MSRCISDRKPPSPVKCLRLLVLGVAALFGSGCAVLPAPETASAVEVPALAAEDSGPLSKSAQAAVTPDQAMRWLREGNEEGMVHLSSENTTATWRGFTLCYRGGWRKDVQLSVSKAR